MSNVQEMVMHKVITLQVQVTPEVVHKKSSTRVDITLLPTKDQEVFITTVFNFLNLNLNLN